MKACEGCQLFGAYEALAGIQGSVILLHSVTGCNFGTLTMDLSQHMDRVNQCCTVISDEDVILGGEKSVEAALHSVWELYRPRVVFVITGCVGSMVGDDVESCIRHASLPCPVLHIPAPGFGGGMDKGYEAAAGKLFSMINPPSGEKTEEKVINLIGLGAGDVRMEADLKALHSLLPKHVRIGMCLSHCGVDAIQEAACGDINLVFGRGMTLARKMKEAFGIPFVKLSYPYGITGEEEFCSALEQTMGISCKKEQKREIAIRHLKKIFAYLQAIYGSSAAIIGTRSRAMGMKRFLEEELGMDVVCFAIREELKDLEEFYDCLRNGEPAVLFGSSFETQIAREINVPLLRFDYPVFDRVCITERPYIGSSGIPYLVEDILNEILSERKNEGALYQ